MSYQEIEIVPSKSLKERLAEDETFFNKMISIYIDVCDFSITEAKLTLPKGSIQALLLEDAEFSTNFTKSLVGVCGVKIVLMLPAVIKALSSALSDSDADARTLMSAVSKHGELLIRLTGKPGKSEANSDKDELEQIYRDMER